MKNYLSDFFGAIYDWVFGIHKEAFPSIFQHFLDSSFYTRLGMISVLIPLLAMFLFYLAWRYPYGRWWHWLIWYIFTLLVIVVVTFNYSNSFILSSNATAMTNCYNVQECSEYIDQLPIRYTIANFIISIIFGILFALGIKQFSKIQAHLPF